MKTLFDTFKTNEDLEKNGVWYEIQPGVRFLVARAGGSNKAYQRALSAKMKPYQRQYQNGTLDPEVAQNLLRDVFIDSVLLGWEGVTDREGQPLEFDHNNAQWLFRELPDLYDALSDEATKVSNYLVQEMNESGNGSSSTLDGS